MELSIYVGKLVRIDLINNYFYQGLVLSSDDNSLTLRDRNGNIVSLKENSILYIREVKNGN